MFAIILSLLCSIRQEFRTRAAIQAEILALRHQLLVPHYLLRDRDGSYGEKLRETASWLGICEVLTTPQSPWQNAYVERLIGSIRRACLDHVIAVGPLNVRKWVGSWKFPKSVDCTIATSESPPDGHSIPSATSRLLTRLCLHAVRDRIRASPNHLWLLKRLRHRFDRREWSFW